MAIIGEPGAGKTTRLQTIADWIFAETEDVAIWISLADLQEKTIEEYLLKVWLKNALKVGRVTSDMEDALVKLFNQGRVWLLLDGVDEMGVKNPLQFINSQISGWVASARIILTCRLNVWDVGHFSYQLSVISYQYLCLFAPHE
ncbi:MAG: NACHT domain-containing protein [Cyanobacteria bacterium P01_H01_bin.35]